MPLIDRIAASRAAIVFLLYAALAPDLAALQKTVKLPNADTCSTCRIVVRKLVILGDSAGPGILGIDQLWQKDSRGRFYHGAWNIGPEIRVFEPNGAFHKLIGRKGTGPGEFEGRTAFFIGRGDTLHAFSPRSGQYSVWTTPDYRVARTARMDVLPRSLLEAPNGDLVIFGLSNTAERIGFPIHRYTRTGKYLSSMGTKDPYAGTTTYFVQRHLSAGPAPHSFLSTHVWNLQIEEWTYDGQLLKTFTANPKWFGPLLSEQSRPLPFGSPHIPPPAQITGLRMGEGGVLWVVVNLPAAKWREAFTVYGRQSVDGPQPDQLYLWDSMIVAIDLKAGSILKHASFKGKIGGFIGSDVYVYIEAPSGDPQVEVWSLRLAR